MADVTEVHEAAEEAKDGFERTVALCVAVLAVALAFIENVSDNSKLDASLCQTRAANKWAHFQAKSVKEHSFDIQREVLEAMAPSAVDEAKRKELVTRYAGKVADYEKEKEGIKKDAEVLEALVEHNNRINNRCDHGALQLQVSIVLASIAILVRWRLFWFVSLVLGATGIGTAATVFFMAAPK